MSRAIDLMDAGGALSVFIGATVLFATSLLFAHLLRYRSAALRHRIWCASLFAAIVLPFAAWMSPTWSVTVWSIETPRQQIDASSIARQPIRRTLPANDLTVDRPADATAPVSITTANPSPSSNLPEPDGERSLRSPAPAGNTTNAHDDFAADQDLADAHISLAHWLIRIWIAGTCIVALFFAVNHLLASLFVHRTRAASEELLSHFHELAANRGLHQCVRLRETCRATSPMASGWWRPSIVVPSDFSSWRRDIQDKVLLHELAHVERWDWAALVIGQFACALYWYHPLAWFAARRLAEEAECAADDAVIVRGASATEYAATLLEIARMFRRSWVLQRASVPMSRYGSMERRVRAVLNERIDRRPMRKRRAWLWAVTFLCIALPATCLRMSVAADEPAATPKDVDAAPASRAATPTQNVVLAVLGEQRFHAPTTLSQLSFTPDGRFLVGVDNDLTLRFWDAQSGAQDRTLDQDLSFPGGRRCSARFTNDMRRVVACGPSHNVVVWNLEAEKIEFALPPRVDFLGGFALSPDETTIATSGEDGKVQVWDANTGALRKEFTDSKVSVEDVEFSADGDSLFGASRNAGVVLRWNLQKGELAETIPADFRWMSLAPRGRYVIGNDPRQITRVFSLEDRKVALELADEGRGWLNAWAFSSDGTWLAIGRLSPEPRDEDPFGGDSKVTERAPARIEIWDLAAGKVVATITDPELARHGDTFGSMCFSPDKSILATATEFNVVRYELPSRRRLDEAIGHRTSVRNVAVSADGRRVASADIDRSIRVWDVANRSEERAIEGPLRALRGGVRWNSTSFCLDGDQLFAGATEDNDVHLWSLDGAAVEKRYSPKEQPRSTVFVHSIVLNESNLAIPFNDELVVFDRESGTERFRRREHWGNIMSMTASRDGKLFATGGADRAVIIWNAEEVKPIRILEGIKGPVGAVSFSADAGRIAAGSYDGDVFVWDLETGAPLAQFVEKRGQFFSVVLSPNGERVATTLGGAMIVRDVASKQEVFRSPPREWGYQCLAYFPDGRKIVAGAADGHVLVFDTEASPSVAK